MGDDQRGRGERRTCYGRGMTAVDGERKNKRMRDERDSECCLWEQGVKRVMGMNMMAVGGGSGVPYEYEYS